MADFQVHPDLLKLTRQSKFRIVTPETYYDVIERYRQLDHPNKLTSSNLAQTKFQLKLDEAKALYDALTDSEINCIALCMQAIRSILKDERCEERIFYPIDIVLMVILLAKVCGCNTADEIASFYKERYLRFFCMLPDMPEPEHMISTTTINRVMCLFKEDEINRLLSSYLRPHC